MARAFVDTSAVYALVDRADANHDAARRILGDLRKRRVEPVLTNFILAESHALLMTRLDPALARRWLMGNAWPVERVADVDESRAREILIRYDDKRFTYTDATSFAVMERLGLREAFAFDIHFRQFGFHLLAPAGT